MSRLIKAVEGKSYSKGGYNVSHLKEIFSERYNMFCAVQCAAKIPYFATSEYDYLEHHLECEKDCKKYPMERCLKYEKEGRKRREHLTQQPIVIF